MATTPADNEAVDDTLLEMNWGTLTVAGGIIAAFGIIAIAFPYLTGLSLTVLLGFLLLGVGIVHGAALFSTRGWKGRIWQLVLGVVAVLAGLSLLINPVVGLATLTVLVIAYLLVEGVVELVASVRMGGQEGSLYVAVSGVLSLVLAGLLWAGFPASAAWAIGLLVGISLLTTGVSTMLVSRSGKRLTQEFDASISDSPKA